MMICDKITMWKYVILRITYKGESYEKNYFPFFVFYNIIFNAEYYDVHRICGNGSRG